MKQIGERIVCIFISVQLMCVLFFEEETVGLKTFWVSVLSSILAVTLEEWRKYLTRKKEEEKENETK